MVPLAWWGGGGPVVWLRWASEGAFPEYWDHVPLCVSVGVQAGAQAGSAPLRALPIPRLQLVSKDFGNGICWDTGLGVCVVWGL